MKGYFSQLAQHTGLRVPSAEPRTPVREVRAAAIPSPTNEAPLDVEEISFTDSRETVGPAHDDIRERSPTRDEKPSAIGSRDAAVGNREPTTVIRIEEPVAGSVDPGGAHDPIEIQDTRLSSGGLASSDTPSNSDSQTNEHWKVVTEVPSTTRFESFNAQPFAQSSSESVTEEFVTVERSFPVISETAQQPSVSNSAQPPFVDKATEAEQPAQTSPRDHREPAGVKPAVLIDQQATIHNQLKEVMAWIAEPPESVEIGSQAANIGEAVRGEELLIQERSSHRPAFDQSHVHEAEVQDLSLSIGSISIVVEEPQKETVPAIIPTAVPEKASTEVSAEPTRLSRYYLSSW